MKKIVMFLGCLAFICVAFSYSTMAVGTCPKCNSAYYVAATCSGTTAETCTSAGVVVNGDCNATQLSGTCILMLGMYTFPATMCEWSNGKCKIWGTGTITTAALNC